MCQSQGGTNKRYCSLFVCFKRKIIAKEITQNEKYEKKKTERAKLNQVSPCILAMLPDEENNKLYYSAKHVGNYF